MRGEALGAQARLLLSHDARRLWGVLRAPSAGVWAGGVIPLGLVVAALALVGRAARPQLRGVDEAVPLGLLLSASIAFLAYGVLFRPADDAFLRRLGLAPGALFLHRAVRLLAASVALVLLGLVPLLAGGGGAPRYGAWAAGAVAPAWALALLVHAVAARQVVPGRKLGVFSRAMGFDRELVRIAPLVYAPLAPLVGGTVGASLVAGSERPGWILVALLAASAVLVALSLSPFAEALPRFAPQVQEMAFQPPPEAGETGLVVGRGVARLLPKGAAAVLARDATVGSRRFPWATRIVWPVVLVAVVIVARWGADPQLRGWVLFAGVGTLLLQGGAVVALGRIEAAGRRWIDRALGLGWGSRWLGRWAWAWGWALWLTVPMALAWAAWISGPEAWAWIGAGMLTAAVASALSLLVAQR